ncbi:MAG: hypothetical protein EOO71_29360 [Myxococcaceae bacterium]|nr:MAG: hypothetical protein EOO71_29360 [Myxococcaceae bacterium]
MSRRSVPSGPVLGAIIILGLFLRLFNRHWLVFVGCGVMVLLGWLAWTLTRKIRPSQNGPRTAPAPVTPPRALLTIDPTVFDDPERTRSAALQVFTTWMQQQPIAPMAPAALVRAVELRTHYLGRLVTTLSERRLEWKHARHDHRVPVSVSRIQANTVDPWAYSKSDLRDASFHITECVPCAERGNVPCPSCRGNKTLTCATCSGTRKAYGIASNGSRRLMKCKQCGATGLLQCSTCSATGTISCSTCRGTGRAERWLEFVETSRTLAHAEFNPEALRMFPWASDGPRASPAAIEEDARVLGELTSRGPLSRERAAELLPDAWLQEHGSRLQCPPGPGERIESQSLRVLSLPSVQLSYAFANEPPTTLHFEGRRMLAPPTSADPRLEALANNLSLARRTLIVLAVGVPFAYLVRGFYFWNAQVLALGLCLAGAAFCGERFLKQRMTGQGPGREWAALTGAALLLTGLLVIGAEPTVRSAESNLAKGQFDEAREELLALGEPDAQEYASTWTALHLALALQGSDIDGVVQEALRLHVGTSGRDSAEQHLHDLARKAVLGHLAAKDPRAARTVLDKTSPVVKQTASLTTKAPSLPLFAELEARVHEADHDTCQTDTCRWASALAAQRAASTTGREQRLEAARAKLMAHLTVPERAKESTPEWLRRLDSFIALARSVGHGSGDADLEAQARTAAMWAEAERRKIPLVGAERAVALNLLGVTQAAAQTVMKTTPSASLYCAMKENHCAGVYLVGNDKSHRVLNAQAHISDTTELLSLALGRPTPLPTAPRRIQGRSVTVSSWTAGAVTVVARWQNTELIELRIGEAKP